MAEQYIQINGKSCVFSSGQTIWEVAEENGIEIPTLCHLKGTLPTGKCGVCVVETAGDGALVTACNTPAEAGLVIWTESRAVIASRKKTIEQLLLSGNHNCAIGSENGSSWTEFQMATQKSDSSDSLCPAWGDCRLQDLAYHYQVTISRDDLTEAVYPMETVNPLIIRDFSRCILCGKCVKACNEVQVNKVISIDEAMTPPKVVTQSDLTLKDSSCVFCGECIQACPVGALVEKKARYDFRPWEVEKIRTTCPYCGVGCQQILHVRDGKIVKVTGAENGAPNYGRLCVKGRFGYDFIYSDERLKTPLIRKDGGGPGEFREASWDEALDLVTEQFKKIIKESGPDALAGVSCARSINEDSYQMQKLFRSVFKTNNIDHCART